MRERFTPETRQAALSAEATRIWQSILNMSCGDVSAAKNAIESTYTIEQYVKNPELLVAVKQVVAKRTVTI